MERIEGVFSRIEGVADLEFSREVIDAFSDHPFFRKLAPGNGRITFTADWNPVLANRMLVYEKYIAIPKEQPPTDYALLGILGAAGECGLQFDGILTAALRTPDGRARYHFLFTDRS